jgi:hypothetical protein
MDDDAPAEGWFVDPYGTHEQRWISQGRPSNLVRDGNTEAKDPPPNRPAPEPFVPISSDPGDVGWRDMRRADDADKQAIPSSGFYGDVAMDGGIVSDNSLIGIGGSTGGGDYDSSLARIPSPSGLPSNAPLTPFQRKVKQQARRKRWAERWNRWFGKAK